MDLSNPYLVHHSDQPGHILVPTKLNGSNYPSWSKSMIHALTTKNKIGFIDGSIESPSETENPKEFALWNHCNNMILSWFTHSVEPDLAKGSIFTLKQLVNFSLLYKTQSLWDELDTYRPISACNQMKEHIAQREEDRIMHFLMGLNDTYSSVRSNILMITPLPNVRQTYSLVIQDEVQREVTTETTENFSIVAAVRNHPNNFSNKSKGKYCEHCDRDSHTIENCRTLKYYCKHCDKRGHTEDRCKYKNGTWTPNIVGNRQGQSQQQRGPRKNTFPTTNATCYLTRGVHPNDSSKISQSIDPTNILQVFLTEQLQQLSRALSTMNPHHNTGNKDSFANAIGLAPFFDVSINSVFTKPWILDSGATDHITSDSSLFTTTQPTPVPIVNLPTGSTAFDHFDWHYIFKPGYHLR
ncbi:uncharacterized protein [Henckelia pumila]|uniref:uncharacterized protein n=1 Tax=Henckelia pumila TaxID=405737 RepID=UPI003C6E7D71